MLSQTSRGFWLGDFWEHAAVVRELIAHPVSPGHPQLALDVPHAFFSPYALAVAALAAAAHLDPVAALSVAGIANLLLLLLGIRAFVGAAFDRDPGAIAFYFLAFLLLLWGERPWFWSGFLHLEALGFVLPYPATFAAGIGFLALAVGARCFRRREPRWGVVLVPLLALLWLTHPNTALAVLVGVSALFVGFGRAPWGWPALVLLAAWGLPPLAAAAWPYYDFADLLLSQSSNPDFHRDSRVLYEGVALRVAPALLGLPLLVLRLRRDRRDFLAWSFLGLAALYAAGGLSGRWGGGRVVSQLVGVLQLTLAAWVAGLEAAGSRRWLLAVLPLLAAAPLATGVLPRSWSAATRSGPPPWARYVDLADHVGQRDVVLTGLGTGWVLPAFAGRVVATQHPLYWVPDHAERRAAVARFFAAATPREERLAIARRHGARFVLLERGQRLAPAVRNELRGLGRVVYRAGGFELIEIEPPPEGS